MIYPRTRGRILSTAHRDTVEEVVRSEVLPRVPRTTYHELRRDLPLRFGTSADEIIAEALPHATGDRSQTSAVYVLECRKSSRPTSDALASGVTPKSEWERQAVGARRVIYVGYTVDLLRRLDEHLNNTDGKGAHFTRVFPPLRILDVSWWSTSSRARRAEPLVASGLRDRFEDDYVYQL